MSKKVSPWPLARVKPGALVDAVADFVQKVKDGTAKKATNAEVARAREDWEARRPSPSEG